MSTLDPDRLLPVDPTTRSVARELFAHVESLPLVCFHGHVPAGWLAEDRPFGDPTELLIRPDHYVTRLLVSRGVALEHLLTGDPREVWNTLCAHWHAFRCTPSRLWWEHVLVEVFGLSATPTPDSYDAIAAALATPTFRPRALFERFAIEVLATTDAAIDPLDHHDRLIAEGWGRRVVPTFRPDDVTDAERPEWLAAVDRLGELTGIDTSSFAGYLDALRSRRQAFIACGATASDHGHPTAATAVLDDADAAALYAGLRASCRAASVPSAADAEQLRAVMLMRHAEMSIDDGLVMQLHAGSLRDHHGGVAAAWGRDRGFDIPTPTDFVRGLRPLLDRVGFSPDLTIVLYTLDESAASRELAPLAGAYPTLLLGAPWWFLDAPDAMLRFREMVSETAGFDNLVGFCDDTRAFLSIPARHNVARRVDVAHLARLVVEGRLPVDEAAEVAVDLAYRTPRRVFGFGH